MSWKGLFIRAAQGTVVKAIAAGQVVFAEWLRGFGNLIIVDHGDGYMSLYSNNEVCISRWVNGFSPVTPSRRSAIVAVSLIQVCTSKCGIKAVLLIPFCG